MCGRSKVSTAARIVKASFASGRDAGRDCVGCIILDRGEGDRKVQQLISVMPKAAVAQDGFGGLRLRRVCCERHDSLESASRMVCEEDHAGRGRKSNSQ